MFAKKNIICYNDGIEKGRKYMAKEINKEKVLEAYKQATKKRNINGRTAICI